MRFPRASRLTSDAQIRRVQREGKLVRTKYLSLRIAASPQARMRVGLIVPRYGRTAVARNRLKRQLREIVRVELLPLQVANDLLIRAAEPAYGLSFARLKEQVLQLAKRAINE